MSDRLEETAGVEPGDPLERGEFDCIGAAPQIVSPDASALQS
jgi:hypothetical protein